MSFECKLDEERGEDKRKGSKERKAAEEERVGGSFEEEESESEAGFRVGGRPGGKFFIVAKISICKHSHFWERLVKKDQKKKCL